MTEFTVTVALEKQDYRELTEASAGHPWRQLLPLLSSAAFALSFSNLGGAAGSLSAFLLAVLGLFWYLAYPPLAAYRGWKVHREVQQEAPTVYRFIEDVIVTSHPKVHREDPYCLIERLEETETVFLLYVGKSLAMILPKGSFSVGTPEEFRAFLAEKTQKQWQFRPTTKNSRRRAVAAITSIAVAFVLVAGIKGMGYIRHPVTTTVSEGTCTMRLPRFLKPVEADGGGAMYTGNDITVWVDFSTHAEIEQRFTYTEEQEQLTLADYAVFRQNHGNGDPDGEWVYASENECYMNLNSGSDYCYEVLYWTEDGCWEIGFRCPGERQDTYYTRFNSWRESAVYS